MIEHEQMSQLDKSHDNVCIGGERDGFEFTLTTTKIETIRHLKGTYERGGKNSAGQTVWSWIPNQSKPTK
tara:strand:+ start:276 stop:485 length:210 start_codon:yes stop_codon:yes gene_type:complete